MTDAARLLFSKISEEFHLIENAYRQFEIGKGRAWDSDGITGITAISRLAGLSFFKNAINKLKWRLVNIIPL